MDARHAEPDADHADALFRRMVADAVARQWRSVDRGTDVPWNTRAVAGGAVSSAGPTNLQQSPLSLVACFNRIRARVRLRNRFLERPARAIGGEIIAARDPGNEPRARLAIADDG